MDDDLIAAHRDLPALMPQLHLPVQSGSDRILDGDEPPPHPRRLSRARSSGCARARPDIAFTSDFIVGFPGETEDDFRDTLRLCRRGRLCRRLSRSNIRRGPARRPPTWTSRLPEAVKAERLQRLQAAIDRHQAAFNGALRRHDLRRAVRKARPPCLARSSAARPYLQPVQVDGAGIDLIGEIAPVTITEVGTNSLFGALARRAGAVAAIARGRQQEPECRCAPLGPPQGLGCRRRGRRRRDPGRARLRRQPPRLGAVRPVRPEPRADRAPARRRRRAARQSRHARRLARRLRAGAPRAGRPLRAASSAATSSSPGDVEGAIRLAIAQGSLFDFDPAATRVGLRGDQSAQAPGARPHRRAGRLYPRAARATRWCSAPARPAPARPGSRSRTRSRCSSARKSTASSCRGRRSRPASGSASCPATCARRSIPICARSTTRCTT